MAHNITIEDAMAYVGRAPWHIGETQDRCKELQDDATFEEWLEAARYNWHVERHPAYYRADDETFHETGHIALVRNDTRRVFSIVSPGYCEVQPREVLEFFKDLTESHGFRLETAGSIKGGAKLWALATNKNQLVIGGIDIIKPYLLLSTAFDKTQATHGKFTTVRVVCNNTLDAAMGERDTDEVVVPHSTKFDEKVVKLRLGLFDQEIAEFEAKAAKLAESQVTEERAREWVTKWFGRLDEKKTNEKGAETITAQSAAVVEDVMTCIGHAPGSDLSTAKGTAWGLLNGVTNYIDYHARTAGKDPVKSSDNRLDSAWFGRGAKKKNAIAAELVELVA